MTKITIQYNILLKTIQSCSYTMSKKEERYNLNSIFFDFNSNEAKIVSTDGSALTLNTIHNEDYYNLELKSEAKSVDFLLSREDINHLIKFLKNNEVKSVKDLQIVDIEIDNEKITFATKHNQANYKLFDATFPEYQRVIQSSYCYKTCENHILLNPAYLSVIGKIFTDCDDVEIFLENPQSPIAIKSSYISYKIYVLYVVMPKKR
jgi:DNA polymerase III sliding clamp (beta) subunit (PCNA family)